jgi:hypothetical protein
MESSTSIWLSAAALLISLSSLVISIAAAIRTAQLQRAHIRTELLTEIVHLRLQYRAFNRRIRQLRENPPAALPPELTALMASERDFLKFERQTESYRQALVARKRALSPIVLLDLRHHIEALVKQLLDDNARLDGILKSLEASDDRTRV